MTNTQEGTEMKQDWTVSVFKIDRRCRAGERFVAKYPFTGMDRATVERELRELTQQLYPKKDGWRFEVNPATKIVRNLMTGKDVEIAYDTPRSCDPSTELYWSM
jgi:hypothetical protein